MNKSVNTKIYLQKLAEKKRRIKKGTNKRLPKEIQYEGTTVFVPILRMSIKLKEGHSIEDWITQYCKRNPNLTKRLYEAYNIPTT